MKISAQLKSVLRHHYEALDVENAYRAEKCQAWKRAVVAMAAKHPALKKMIKRAAVLRKELDDLQASLAEFGVSTFGSIGNAWMFASKGGVVENVPVPKSFEHKLAELAKLSPDEGLKWLKEWGVDWTPVRGA